MEPDAKPIDTLRGMHLYLLGLGMQPSMLRMSCSAMANYLHPIVEEVRKHGLPDACGIRPGLLDDILEAIQACKAPPGISQDIITTCPKEFDALERIALAHMPADAAMLAMAAFHASIGLLVDPNSMLAACAFDEADETGMHTAEAADRPGRPGMVRQAADILRGCVGTLSDAAVLGWQRIRTSEGTRTSHESYAVADEVDFDDAFMGEEIASGFKMAGNVPSPSVQQAVEGAAGPMLAMLSDSLPELTTGINEALARLETNVLSPLADLYRLQGHGRQNMTPHVRIGRIMPTMHRMSVSVGAGPAGIGRHVLEVVVPGIMWDDRHPHTAWVTRLVDKASLDARNVQVSKVEASIRSLLEMSIAVHATSEGFWTDLSIQAVPCLPGETSKERNARRKHAGTIRAEIKKVDPSVSREVLRRIPQLDNKVAVQNDKNSNSWEEFEDTFPDWPLEEPVKVQRDDGPRPKDSEDISKWWESL